MMSHTSKSMENKSLRQNVRNDVKKVCHDIIYYIQIHRDIKKYGKFVMTSNSWSRRQNLCWSYLKCKIKILLISQMVFDLTYEIPFLPQVTSYMTFFCQRSIFIGQQQIDTMLYWVLQRSQNTLCRDLDHNVDVIAIYVLSWIITLML